MTALNFALTKIHVSDIDTAERFYTETLGLVQTARLEVGEGEYAFKEAILSIPSASIDGAKLGLVQYLSKPAPAPGEAVFAFMVDDVERVASTMVKAGGTIVSPVREIPEHHLKLAYVADPEGHVVEIMQLIQQAGI